MLSFSGFMVVFLTSYLLFFFLAIPLHELGHLVFGLATGYRFVSFRVFSWVWVRENGKIVVKKATSQLVMGQCLLSPPPWKDGFPFVLYNLGGDFFNLIVALLAGAGFLVADSGSVLWAVLLGVGLSNAITGLMNILPMGSTVPNDGRNVFTALRSKTAARGLYLMLKINDENSEGKRLRDYDSEIFATSPAENFKNYFVAYIVLCEAGRLADLGLWEESILTYGKLPLEKLPAYYRNCVIADLIFYHSAIQLNPATAAELYEKKGMAKFLTLGLPALTRALAAYEFFVAGNKEQGEKLLEKAKSEAENTPNIGQKAMECAYLAQLEQLMQTPPPQTVFDNGATPRV